MNYYDAWPRSSRRCASAAAAQDSTSSPPREDLAAIWPGEVGGDHVNVDSIAKGYQDPHFVEPKPSFLLKLQKADLLAVVGLQLEIGWLPPLITQSRNAKIQVGGPGYLDMSQFCQILENPAGQVTRAMGDVHPLGNPHYWLNPGQWPAHRQGSSPTNSRVMHPADAAYFAQRYADFDKRLTDAEKGWDAKMAPYQGPQSDHLSPLLAELLRALRAGRGGLCRAQARHPAHARSHTLELINTMKRDNIKLILVEPYFDLRTPNSIAAGRRRHRWRC